MVALAAVSQVDIPTLRNIAGENVIGLGSCDSSSLAAYFRYVSPSIAVSSKRLDAGGKEAGNISELPPPQPEIASLMRKLPIYILLDASGCMRGEPIEAVKTGLRALFKALVKDPYALETVQISIITFDREARLLMPMTEVDKAPLPEMPELQSSPTNMGEALELMLKRYDAEVRRTTPELKGDWLPLALIMTDGAPSDTLLFNSMCEAVKKRPFSRIIGCAAGPKAKTGPLKRFCTDVVALETMDSSAFANFWKWVSQAVTKHGRSGNTVAAELPPPPPELDLSV
ncbi:MAG: VWA domain-containing protein [Deltaproteobacteria bacterium]|nr:VWA domain-containing protein [Deltaproteobacteria bacterium]